MPLEEHDITSPGDLRIPICTTPSETGTGTPVSELTSPGLGSPAAGRSLVTETLKKQHAEMIARLSIEDAVAGSEPVQRTVVAEEAIVEEPESLEDGNKLDGDAVKADAALAADEDADANTGNAASFSG